MPGKCHLARCAARRLNEPTSPPRRCACSNAMPNASPDTKNDNAGHRTLREESVMKCSNPHCNRGIGLVAHRRGWFDKRRYCSKECRNTFVAQRPKISQQERSVMTYVEWLFLQPVENPRSQSRPAKRWEICYSTRSDARRDLVYLGGGRADFLTTRR